jgi:hypothetical protein
MELAKIEVMTDGGPWATHNMPCPVCRDNHALLDLSCGVMKPCRHCREKGYRLVLGETWFQRWILNTFFCEWRAHAYTVTTKPKESGR